MDVRSTLPYPPPYPSARRCSLDPELRRQILRVYWTQNCSLRELAAGFHISHMTVWRLVKDSARPM